MKAVIFDLDNTLIDFLKMKRISIEQAVDAMRDAGLEMEKDKAIKLLYTIYKKDGMEDHNIFQKFLQKAEGKVDFKKLAYAIVAYRQARIGFLHPYPGTKRTLIALKEKGLKLAIVSDAPKLKAWIRLATMKIDDFFDAVVGFEDTGRHKPAIEPFLAATKQLKVSPEDCLMVGDFPSKDIKGAKKLGMKTCFARYGSPKCKKAPSDYSICSIEELIGIL